MCRERPNHLLDQKVRNREVEVQARHGIHRTLRVVRRYENQMRIGVVRDSLDLGKTMAMDDIRLNFVNKIVLDDWLERPAVIQPFAGGERHSRLLPDKPEGFNRLGSSRLLYEHRVKRGNSIREFDQMDGPQSPVSFQQQVEVVAHARPRRLYDFRAEANRPAGIDYLPAVVTRP